MGIRLYYINENSTSGDTRPNLSEMKWTNTTGWSTPTTLPATADSTSAALTVSSYEDQVYLLYINSRGNLEGLGREGGRTGIWTNGMFYFYAHSENLVKVHC